MVEGSFFKKALYLLEIVSKDNDKELLNLLKREPVFAEILTHLFELELVSMKKGIFVITEKGKNVYNYFNKLGWITIQKSEYTN
jgi:hypothetical protein